MLLTFLLLTNVCSKSFEHAIIYGDIEHLSYYYVNLEIGTTRAQQSVLIDTGSSLTAFPCKTCESCGDHIHDYFDYKSSNSSREVTCDEGIDCSSCKHNKCGYSLSYAEGSSIAGVLIEDTVRFGNDSTPFIFGCHSTETNLFTSQIADGIMGMGRERRGYRSLVDTLYNAKGIDSRMFGICAGKVDGYMTIGGFNESLITSEMTWVPLYDDQFYAVFLVNIFVDSKSLHLSSADFGSKYTTGTIVDSGTTFVYFKKKVYEAFWNGIHNFCKKSGNCLGESVSQSRQTQYCYYYDSDSFNDIQEFYDTFPVLSLVIDSQMVKWKPENYLFSYPNYPDNYCIGVYKAEKVNILGALFMRGKEVVFNEGENRIGFADSLCDPSLIDTNYVSGEWMAYIQNTGTNWTYVMIGLIVLGGITISFYIFARTKNPDKIKIKDVDSQID